MSHIIVKRRKNVRTGISRFTLYLEGEHAGMEISKEELVTCIEKARRKLEGSIEDGEEYCYVYENSVELDRLIEIYIAMGY